MKKMLKYLLTFIFTFVLIGQVNALEVNYEWGKEFTDLQTIYGMYPDEEGFVLDIADINWDYYLDLYDDNLEFIEEYDYDKSCSLYLPSTEIEGETYSLNVYNYYSAPAPISSQNVVDSRADIGNHHDIRLLDENCEEVDSVSIEYSGNFFMLNILMN